MRSELSPILRLALPLVLVNVGNKLMGVVDTMLAGRLGPVAIGATGLGTDIFFTGSLVAIGVLIGLDPLVAQAFGAGRTRLARRTMWQGVWAAFALCVPVTLAVVALALSLERFGVDAEMARLTRSYVYVRLPSLLPMLVFIAGRTYLQAAQTTRPIVIAMVAANVVNFGAAWALCYGVPALGVPAFGVPGLAAATVLATFVEVIVLALGLRGLPPGEGSEPLRSYDGALQRKLFWVGLPIGFQVLAEVGVFVLTGVLIAGISTPAAAAHRIAIDIASMTFMIPLALGSATSVRVGLAIGGRDHPGTRRAGVAGIVLAAGFMAASSAAMVFAPGPIVRLWTTDPGVLPLATSLIRIAAAFQIFDGVQVVAAGALRGAGLTRWTLGANLVAYWVVALPVGLGLCFGLGLGPRGLWWGLTFGLACAAVVLMAMFLRVVRHPIEPTLVSVPSATH